MTKEEAYALKHGDKISAIRRVPDGIERGIDGKCPPIKKDEVLSVREVIPKVRIVNIYPWQDGYDEMLFCETASGSRAWLNISNAKKH